MTDIGLVKYEINSENNSLDSEWIYAVPGKLFQGTGVTESDRITEFEGSYKVSYFDEEGKPYLKFDMEIKKVDDHYWVDWLNNGKVQFIGIGQVYNGALFAGWKKAG